MDWQVTLFDTTVDAAEINAVSQVLTSRWLSVGAVTEAFENEFAQQLQTTGAVAVSSGTAALHLAVLALELQPGDEVIMPSMSFVASAAVTAHSGAKPVFAEIKGPHDLTIDPVDIERRITPRTRAIIAMHYGGYACDMTAILALAQKYGLTVIEDAAHAPLVQTEHGMLGTSGHIGCFSFFATKNITTGEGGMVVAQDPHILQKVRSLRSHCMTTSSWDKQKGRSSSYDVHGLGLNYRITDIGSAMGRVQLQKLAHDRQRRKALVQLYFSLLQDLPEISLPFFARQGDCAYHLFPLILSPNLDRGMIQESLKMQGIQSSVHYPPTHLFSFYQEQYGYQPGSLPITEDVAARELTLPLHPLLSDDQVSYVATAVRRLATGINSASRR
jgi:dTDP-4-amino-4,6-dideoxygalactose transaminase